MIGDRGPIRNDLLKMEPGKIIAPVPEPTPILRIEYPSSYIVWDLETSGLNERECKILEIGALEIENGEVIGEHAWLLNHNIEIPEIITTITGLTKEKLDAEGKDPATCLSEFMDLLNPASGRPHLTHNGFRFDLPWLVHHAATTFALHPDDKEQLKEQLERSMLDTAVFVKARKLNMPRQFNESMSDWAKRVMNVIAKGVKYNVAICCEEMGISMEGIEQHRAGGDVVLTNEIYKQIVWPGYVNVHHAEQSR